MTNGETTDYADTSAGTVAYTPELGEGTAGSGIRVPGRRGADPGGVRADARLPPGAGQVGGDPDDPESPVGIDVEPFYLDADDIDPQNGQTSLFDFKFSVSYGDPQEVRVLAKRSLGKVTLQATGSTAARCRRARTSEWDGRRALRRRQRHLLPRGQRRGHRHRPRATASRSGSRAAARRATRSPTTSSPTPASACWSSRPRTTRARRRPQPPGGPHYLSYYKDALTANGVDFDVYDVDAHGRTAPDNLGVLSHYDAVVWYTGDDVVTREPGWGPGNASRLAMQELLEVRDFVNEGGRVLYTGQRAGQQYTTGLGTQLYDPFENRAVPRRPRRAGGLPGPVRVRRLAG